MLDFALAILRLGIGAPLVLLHGQGKLSAALAHFVTGKDWGFINTVHSLGFPFPTFFAAAAAFAEGIGAILLAIGLITRSAALLVVSTMLVASYRHVRAGEVPELAGLYLVGATVIAITGPGAYSFDAFRSRRPRKSKSTWGRL